MEHITDFHEFETYRQSYKDAAAYIEAWRADDGREIARIEETTWCIPCLMHCSAVTAGLLGDKGLFTDQGVEADGASLAG